MYFIIAHAPGWTLIELLIVSLIVVMIMGFAFPWTWKNIQQHQRHVMVNTITQAIEYARLDAMLRNETLLLTPFADQADFSTGMMLSRQPSVCAPDDCVVHTWSWNTSFHVIWHGFLFKNTLLFAPDVAHSAMNGYFELTAPNAYPTRLWVNRLGRVREQKNANSFSSFTLVNI